MFATQQLRSEHKGITLMLGILAKICRRADSGHRINGRHLKEIVRFLEVFVNRCHLAKEEEALFPALEAVGIPREGGPIGTMFMDHERGRQMVAEMKSAVDLYETDPGASGRRFCAAVRQYTELLSAHMREESELVLALADCALSPEKQHDLATVFERLEKERIGEGKCEQFQDLLEALATIYGI